MRYVLVLVGPTATGKTAVAMEVATLLPVEIIAADSRQVYKYLDIGTSKPTPQQLRAVKHYFVDEYLPDREFSAGEFGKKGREIIEEIFAGGKTPFVVGGSGLYVRSLLDGLFEGPAADKEYRAILERRVRAGELKKLHDELRTVDPVSAQRIDPTKPRRIIRALEVYYLTGKPISQLQREAKVQTNFTPVIFGLAWNRKELYRRIDRRCEEMLAAGLLREVEELERRGYSPSLNALNTVGYAEAFAHRRGEIRYDEMVRLMKQNTRRYAKRQLTWFRRDKRIRWLPMNEQTEPASVARRIYEDFLAAQKEV